MTNSLKPLVFGKDLISVEEALAELEGYTPRREPEPDSNPDIEPSGDPDDNRSESVIVPEDYILLEGTSHYDDTLISTVKTHFNKNWFQAHEELHKQRKYMPTIRQLVDFIQLLKSGHAFNGQGKKIPSSQLEAILKEITEVRDPWRSEWLDAKFDGNNMSYNHKTQNGQLKPNSTEQIQDCIMEDCYVDISSANSQGLPTIKQPNSGIYFWYPRNSAVAWFYAGSDWAVLLCDGNPWGSVASLGVRPCARKK